MEHIQYLLVPKRQVLQMGAELIRLDSVPKLADFGVFCPLESQT